MTVPGDSFWAPASDAPQVAQTTASGRLAAPQLGQGELALSGPPVTSSHLVAPDRPQPDLTVSFGPIAVEDSQKRPEMKGGWRPRDRPGVDLAAAARTRLFP